MAPQQPRFSRRFLTILIFVTCVAIVLLSKMDGGEEPQATDNPPAQQQSEQP